MVTELMQQVRPAKRLGTAQPRRVQLRRSKGWRMPANTVKVDRSTPFGNPFTVKDYGQARAIRLFCAWINGQPIANPILPADPVELARRRAALLAALPDLRGKNLACWCPLPDGGRADSCHAAVLLALANAETNAGHGHQSASCVARGRAAARMLRKVME